MLMCENSSMNAWASDRVTDDRQTDRQKKQNDAHKNSQKTFHNVQQLTKWKQ